MKPKPPRFKPGDKAKGMIIIRFLDRREKPPGSGRFVNFYETQCQCCAEIEERSQDALVQKKAGWFCFSCRIDAEVKDAIAVLKKLQRQESQTLSPEERQRLAFDPIELLAINRPAPRIIDTEWSPR